MTQQLHLLQRFVLVHRAQGKHLAPNDDPTGGTFVAGLLRHVRGHLGRRAAVAAIPPVLPLEALCLSLHLVENGVEGGEDVARAFLRAQQDAFPADRHLCHLAVVGAAGRLDVGQVHLNGLDRIKVAIQSSRLARHILLQSIGQLHIADQNGDLGCHDLSPGACGEAMLAPRSARRPPLRRHAERRGRTLPESRRSCRRRR